MTTDIIRAITDPRIIGDTLSPAQEALLRLIYGLPLSSEQLGIAREATGRQDCDQPRSYKTALTVAGRRSGKSSRIASNIVVFEACVNQHPIPPGERGTVLLIGPTERQARHTFRMIESKIRRSSTLKGLIQNVRSSPNESLIELANGIDISVAAANAKHVRGANVVAGVLEEACFFRDSESGEFNLEEIINAVRPGMLTVPDSRMVVVSSPWAMLGWVWSTYRDRDKHPDILVWKAPSWVMNPSLPADELERERQRSEPYWRREFACEFVQAASALLPSDLVERCVARGTLEFPPRNEWAYCCSLDPSSKGDDFAMSISHAEGARIVIDYVKAWRAPGRGKYIDYNIVLPHVIDTMTRYGAPKAWSDQVSAAAIDAAMRKAALQFEQTTTFGTKAAPKFQTLRQKIVSGELVLPDDPELVDQLKALEEILAEGGRSTVEARSGKDDKAVSVALAVYVAATQVFAKPWVGFFRMRPDPRGHFGNPAPVSVDDDGCTWVSIL